MQLGSCLRQRFLSPVLPPGLSGGSSLGLLGVIDEGAIRYLSVSLLWCQHDEGEIKRGRRSGVQQRVSAEVLSFFFFIPSLLTGRPGEKKRALNL